jgi:hypothetical protein
MVGSMVVLDLVVGSGGFDGTSDKRPEQSSDLLAAAPRMDI